MSRTQSIADQFDCGYTTNFDEGESSGYNGDGYSRLSGHTTIEPIDSSNNPSTNDIQSFLDDFLIEWNEEESNAILEAEKSSGPGQSSESDQCASVEPSASGLDNRPGKRYARSLSPNKSKFSRFSTGAEVSVDSVNNDSITIDQWIEKIKNGDVKNRLVHDIVDTRNSARRNFVIQKLRSIEKFSGFVFAVEHKIPNFEHLHIIHNCNYTNGCRCSFLQNIPVKRRKFGSIKNVFELSDEYLWNLFEYLTRERYEIIQVFVGDKSWKLLSDHASKCILKSIVCTFILIYIYR